MAKRVIFMGSPDFALPTLQALTERYEVVGVVTQPDRPAGRGRSLTPPPVKVLAQSLGLEFIQPQRMKEPGALEQLQSWNPDLIVVAAFGQILRQNVLDLPAYGCINVHASLLPRWRGAAPIQAAILAGDELSGVTIMKMDAGIDTGAWLSMREEPILPDDTAETLSARLAKLGAELLMETLPLYLEGKLTPIPQDESTSTYARMIQKEQGQLDFSQPAQQLERMIRAYQPWPGAHTQIGETMLKVTRAHVSKGGANPGDLSIINNLPAIGTCDGWLVLDEVQPAGKKPMPGAVFLNGARNWWK